MTNQNPDPAEPPGPPASSNGRIAVAIPCYNEAPAIATVIAQFREVLPDAEIVVFDNNSTDGTGDVARSLGVRVVVVPKQGKGHAVRVAFETLRDFEVMLLTDGDGTYPAAAAPLLIAPILNEDADMTIGARQPARGAGAMTLTRTIGNRLIRTAFRVLIGPGNSDLLSGYRAFSLRFREDVKLVSAGFEIETELSSEAVARGFKILEISVPYHPRIAGTESKLRAFSDGWRILLTIVMQSYRLTPRRIGVLENLAWLAFLIGALNNLFRFIGNRFPDYLMLMGMMMGVVLELSKKRLRAISSSKSQS